MKTRHITLSTGPSVADPVWLLNAWVVEHTLTVKDGKSETTRKTSITLSGWKWRLLARVANWMVPKLPFEYPEGTVVQD